MASNKNFEKKGKKLNLSKTIELLKIIIGCGTLVSKCK